MTKQKARRRREVKQELDMAEHATRLRSIPAGTGEFLRQVLIWIAAGVLLFALGWLALVR